MIFTVSLYDQFVRFSYVPRDIKTLASHGIPHAAFATFSLFDSYIGVKLENFQDGMH